MSLRICLYFIVGYVYFDIKYRKENIYNERLPVAISWKWTADN
jgi:hypothetical protein